MKPQTQTIIIPFPIKGLDTSGARNEQPPTTTPSLLNVRIQDRFGRARGCQRGGFTRMWQDSVSSSVLYYQCKSCKDDALVPLFVKASEVTPTYRFKWSPGDNQCYYITSTNPKTYTPGSGTIVHAASRITVSTCADVTCGSEFNPPQYRQCRLCSSGELVNLWVNRDEIASYPYYFKFDDNCYKVLSTDDASTSPGLIAPSGSRTAKASCSASGCTCGTCAVTPADFSWDTGTVSEHNNGGSPNFIRSSPTFSVCTESEDGILFSGISDDFVILTKSTDSITQTYSGIAGDPVTITLPTHYVIFRNTFGHTQYTNTVEKTFVDGTHTFVLAAGTPGVGAGSVEDMEADGYDTRSLSTPVTWAEMTSRGWIDADNIARLKLWHVVSGNGRANITSVTCYTGGGVTLYSTGEDLVAGAECDEDQWWVARGVTAKSNPTAEPDGWVAAPADSTWISHNCTLAEETLVAYTDEYITHIYIDTDVDIPTLEIPFQAAVDNSATIWIRNGSGDTDTGLTLGDYASLTSDTLTGAMGFEVGDNQLVVKVYNWYSFGGLVFKFGTPTWTP